jgi:hypothetical protein
VRDVYAVISRRRPAQCAGDPLEHAFGRPAKALRKGALSARKATPEELAELRRLLPEYEDGLKAVVEAWVDTP